MQGCGVQGAERASGGCAGVGPDGVATSAVRTMAGESMVARNMAVHAGGVAGDPSPVVDLNST